MQAANRPSSHTTPTSDATTVGSGRSTPLIFGVGNASPILSAQRTRQGKVREVHGDLWRQQLLHPLSRPPPAAPSPLPHSAPAQTPRARTYEELIQDVKRNELKQAQQSFQRQQRPPSSTMSIFATAEEKQPVPSRCSTPQPIVAHRKCTLSVFGESEKPAPWAENRKYHGLDADQLREVAVRKAAELARLEDQWKDVVDGEPRLCLLEYKIRAVKASIEDLGDDDVLIREMALSAEVLSALGVQIATRQKQLAQLAKTTTKREKVEQVLAEKARIARLRSEIGRSSGERMATLRQKSEKGLLEQVEQTRIDISFDDELIRRMALLFKDAGGR